MAADAFSKLITTISVKTSSSLEKSKIKMHIENLEKEIDQLIRAAGEEGYNLWESGSSDTNSLKEKFKAIQERKEQIQQLNAKMGEIDELDSQILGAKKQEEAAVVAAPAPAAPAAGTAFCPGCGTQYTAPAKFCRKCGRNLQ